MAGQKKKANRKFGWAQAFRDIVVAAINRGQLPVMGFLVVVVLMLWRLPPEDVSKLVFLLYEDLKNFEFFAYILLFICISAGFYIFKNQRRIYSEEFKRIGREKSELQNLLAGKRFESSDKASTKKPKK